LLVTSLRRCVRKNPLNRYPLLINKCSKLPKFAPRCNATAVDLRLDQSRQSSLVKNISCRVNLFTATSGVYIRSVSIITEELFRTPRRTTFHL